MPDPQIVVRAEAIADYAAIADIHMRAFGGGYGEGQIVALHRQRPGYDPRLSLVAERGGEVIGHILYSPRTFRLLDVDVNGVNLSPLGIHPLWQRQGIGGALMEAGDAEARRLGYELSVVLGHSAYYPRFGYQVQAYGSSQLRVQAATLNDVRQLTTSLLETRAPTAEDAPALMQIWRADESAVDFSVVPDATALWWHSPDPRVNCTVYLSGGRIVGYTRVSSAEPAAVRLFIAADAQSALLMAVHVTAGGDAILPLHPYSASGNYLAARLGVPDVQAWDAGMAKSLHLNPFDDYLPQVRRAERLVGRPIWPAEFDV